MNDLQIQVIEDNTPAAPAVQDNPKQLAITYLENMGVKIPEQFQTQFIELASAMKLNPFLNEIHAITYNTKEEQVFKCVTGFMVYIKRAERSGKLNGWDVSSTGNNENIVSTLTIYRKDWDRPFKHSVRFREVAQYDGTNQLSRMWRKMPVYMCEKACISQGFRLCFPDELAGMPYTQEELPEGTVLSSGMNAPEKLIDAPQTPEQKTLPMQTPEAATPEQMGMCKAADLPQQKGGASTPEEVIEIKNLLSAKDGAGNPIFSLEEKKNYGAMRLELYTAQELIAVIKAELQRRLNQNEQIPQPQNIN